MLSKNSCFVDFLVYKGYNLIMVRRIFQVIVSGILALGVGSLIATTPVGALNGSWQGGLDSARGSGVPTNLADGDGSLVRRIINILLYAVAVISVIMLIIGGFRYVISGGQKESVTAAKNTILYAIVGLLVAIFAYAIIKFVVGAAIGTDSSTDI